MNTKKITIEYDADLIQGNDAEDLLELVKEATEKFRDDFYQQHAPEDDEEDEEDKTPDDDDEDDDEDTDSDAKYTADVEKVIPGASIIVFGPER